MKTRYFYTKHYPFQWIIGPMFLDYNDEGEHITSLEEAKALALSHRKETMREDHVDTTYGIQYYD